MQTLPIDIKCCVAPRRSGESKNPVLQFSCCLFCGDDHNVRMPAGRGLRLWSPYCPGLALKLLLSCLYLCAFAVPAATASATHCNATWKAVGLACSRSCGGGVRGEKYEVKTAASGANAKACEAANGTTRTVGCNTQPCGMTAAKQKEQPRAFLVLCFFFTAHCERMPTLSIEVCKQHETSNQASTVHRTLKISQVKFCAILLAGMVT